MTDCFALLEEPRRPWLEPESLKQKFLALSAHLHPDRVHNASPAEKSAAQQRYTELNAAYQRLREPKERLVHLLELESGAKPKEVQPIPVHFISLFDEINRIRSQTDSLLVEKRAATSPLLQVQLFDRAQQQIEQLTGLQRTLQSQQDLIVAEVKVIDAQWEHLPADEPARRTALARLEALCPLLSYLSRWTSQIQEQIVQLAL